MIFYIGSGAAIVFIIVLLGYIMWRADMLGGFGILFAIAMIGALLKTFLPDMAFAIVTFLAAFSFLGLLFWWFYQQAKEYDSKH